MAVSNDAALQFEALFREMVPEIRAFSRRHGGSDIVDDVVSETFLVVWRRWEVAPAEHDGKRRWVYGIARHKIAHAIDARRRARQGLLIVARQLDTQAAHPDPSEDVVQRDRVIEILSGLTPTERDAMAATVLEGMSVAEAAQHLGCSVTALTTRLMRARRAVRAAAELQTQGVKEVVRDGR